MIVADPRVLGMLRSELTKPTADFVTTSIGKTAVRLKPAEVADLVAKG